MLTVKEALQFEYLDEFTLLAGASGLDRKVETIGILDHEILEDMMDIFVEGEFVLSTLSIARDDVQLVYKAIKSLNASKAAALAFKSVYYETLPDDILEYANEIGFPVFVFHPSIFIEHIIGTVFHHIRSKGIHSIREMKLETLFKGQLMSGTVREITMELNPEFEKTLCTFYFKSSRYQSDDAIIRLIEKYERIKENHSNSLFRFRDGFIFVLSGDILQHTMLDFNHMLQVLDIRRDDFITGVSLNHNLNELDLAIQECFYAYQAAVIEEQPYLNYKGIGINKLLMAIDKQPWAIKYVEEIISPIIDYDAQYNTALYKTAVLYFKMGCRTGEVAKHLFQHKNTILYRIKKVKELTGPYNSDHDFHMQISTAIKLFESQKRL